MTAHRASAGSADFIRRHPSPPVQREAVPCDVYSLVKPGFSRQRDIFESFERCWEFARQGGARVRTNA
jgi:hypothetical protein